MPWQVLAILIHESLRCYLSDVSLPYCKVHHAIARKLATYIERTSQVAPSLGNSDLLLSHPEPT